MHQPHDEALDFLTDQERRRTLQVCMTGSRIEHLAGGARGHLLPDAGIRIHVEFESKLDTQDVNFGLVINDVEGRLVFGTNTRLLDQTIEIREGVGEAVFQLDRIPLLDGTYTVTLGITSYDEGVVYDWREEALQFEVMNPGGSVGYADIPIELEATSSPLSPGVVK